MAVTMDDFRRMELRIGEVVSAEPMTGTDRLLRLVVDLAHERRQLVGGVGRSHSAQELTGRQVVVMANMAPAKIRGVTSQGMLLGVGCDDPRAVSLLTVDRPVPNGSLVE